MMDHVLDAAGRVSDIIKNSTHYSMLLNRREDVHQIITTIGREPGVEGIRIYNKRGVIMFSTNKAEQSSVVDMRGEACYACHDSEQPLQSLSIRNRSRIYTSPAGYRVVGLINPIRNEPACSNSPCHAHPTDRTVLGVLDVRMSLEKADQNLEQARQKLLLGAGIMTLIVALSSGLFLLLLVHRPVKRLMRGTREIASGNLDHHIALHSKDEIGRLAQAFNEMMRSLREAEKENRLWSETLEKRVEEKTAELRHMHEQIMHIEKMASLGKLSATVAHELNNPLEGILTYAKLNAKRLRKLENPTESQRQMLEDVDLIIREVQRCGNIVKNLLLFSKKQVGDFGLFPVPAIVDKAVQLIRHHLEISNVTFEADFQAEDPVLMCDENQLQQAIVALCVNAVEAMPGGGKLKVTLRRTEEGDLQLRLADTGSGIAAEDLPHVFEPFFTTKKDGKGVGLGLSIVYGIIERHGGTVTAESAPGQGTQFIVTFPAPAKDQPRLEPNRHATVATG
jgi:two-component system NtrC family sensor kinase